MNTIENMNTIESSHSVKWDKGFPCYYFLEGLLLEDIDFEEFTITVRNTKNRIDRTVMVTEKCIKAIEQYLENRVDTEKILFVSRKKRRISRNQVNRLRLIVRP